MLMLVLFAVAVVCFTVSLMATMIEERRLRKWAEYFKDAKRRFDEGDTRVLPIKAPPFIWWSSLPNCIAMMCFVGIDYLIESSLFWLQVFITVFMIANTYRELRREL